MSDQVLKRTSDSWTFTGDFTDVTPVVPRMKTNEIVVIRGASRYQSLGVAGSKVKFTLMFRGNAGEALNFMSRIDEQFIYTDDLGKNYKGVFKDDPEIKKYGVGLNQVMLITVTLYSPDIAGVGSGVI